MDYKEDISIALWALEGDLETIIEEGADCFSKENYESMLKAVKDLKSYLNIKEIKNENEI